jgi:hypothetical protein
MTKIEEYFLTKVLKHLPTAKKIELKEKEQTLYVFFSTKDNEFDETEGKIMGLLRVYSLLGEERFDEFLSDIEALYRTFQLKGEAHNLDVKFMFI